MGASSRSSVRSRGARQRPRYGSETPRIFTPPLRKLTPQTSLGFAVIEFARDVCGVDLYPWQQWLLIHALELAPDLTVDTMHNRGRLDPVFRFRKIVVLVARQNGKSTLSQILSLFFLYVLGTDLVLGTAQDLDTAEEVWDGALEIIEETPELAELADKPIRVNGKKTIRLLNDPDKGVRGQRYKVKAANRRAGRGLSGDLILLDELREHQSWDAWGAITKTTQARPAAMIWALSNAGDATSIVLRYLRKQAHAALGDPDGINTADDPAALLPSEKDLDDLVELSNGELTPGDLFPEDFEEDGSTLGLFEWSAPPGVPVTDLDGILQANPSCGYGISLRTLMDDARSDPEWVFRTECLCQWSDGSLEGPFPPGSWEAGLDPKSKVAKGNDVGVCVDASWNRTMAHVGIAGLRKAGGHHVGIVASRAGLDWVIPWLQSDDGPPGNTVAVQANGPAGSLVKPLRKAGFEVVEWSGAELGRGTGAFYDGVRAWLPNEDDDKDDQEPVNRIYHRAQPLLDLAAATAVPKMLDGGSMVWDRKKSPVDASPLVAVTGALWVLDHLPEESPPPDIF